MVQIAAELGDTSNNPPRTRLLSFLRRFCPHCCDPRGDICRPGAFRMRICVAALGLGLVLSPGVADAFVAPAGGLDTAHPSRNAALSLAMDRGGESSMAGGAGWCSRSAGLKPTTVAPTSDGGDGTATSRGWSSISRRRSAALSARANRDAEDAGDKKPSSAAAMSGIGSTGSNVLLLVATAMVLKGLFLPEDIRHLGFCPPDDPVRGRDTLPWRMMIESGRECGTIEEVMTKYVTAPLVFPGTPEWGMMLNVKEDLAKDLP